MSQSSAWRAYKEFFTSEGSKAEMRAFNGGYTAGFRAGSQSNSKVEVKEMATQQASPTPAPWRASEGATGVIVNYVTDEDRPGSGIATICQMVDHDGSAWPDALLIAAAPNLLAACCEALRREEDAGESAGSSQFIERLRAAIAKAIPNDPEIWWL